MYPASETYKDNIMGSPRQMRARVTFDISDVTAADDVTSMSSSGEAVGLSMLSQLNDNERTLANHATLEPDRFKLDGSFTFVDEPTPAADVTWTNRINVNVTAGNGLVKTSADAWDGGAVTSQYVTGEGGYIEYVADGTNPHRMIGFTTQASPTSYWYSFLRYAIYMDSANAVGIFEDGTNVGFPTTYVAGDIFRIAIEGVTVKYYKNNALIYTSTKKLALPLYAGAVVYNLAGLVGNIRMGGSRAANGEMGYVSDVLSNATGLFLDNMLGTDGSCESLTPFSLNSAAPTLSTTQKRSGTYSFKLTAANSNVYAYKDYTTTLRKDTCYILCGWVYIESFTTGAVSIRLWEPGGFVQTRYGVSATTSIVGSWQFLYVKIPLANTFTGAGFRIQIGNGTQATMVGYIDEVRLYEITPIEYDALATMTTDQIATMYPYQETVRPTITQVFSTTHSSAGLTIAFDSVNNEYATHFVISAYNASDVLIASATVTDNTETLLSPLGQLANYKKLTLSILRWSKPYRRARVAEIDYGLVKVYTEENIIGLSMVEEIDYTARLIPSPEFRFTLENKDKLFNILNPTGFYAYLQQRQQVIVELGLVGPDKNTIWVPMGNYLLWEWRTDDAILGAAFVARTHIDLMDQFEYVQSVAQSTNLYQLAVDNFAACGITNYSVDPALQYVTTNALSPKITRRQLLQMIAFAGCANVWVTRNNTIMVQSSKTRKVRYIRDWSNGSSVNIGDYWVEVQALTAVGTNVALGKTVTATSASGEGTTALITDGDTASIPYFGGGVGLQNVTVDLGAIYDIATVKVWHFWADGRTFYSTKTEISEDGVNWTVVFDSAVSGAYAESSTGRTYSMDLVRNIAPPAVGAITMDDTEADPDIILDPAAYRVEVGYWTNATTTASVTATNADTATGSVTKVLQNTLINSSAQATVVANWFLNRLLARRMQYRSTWRGDPTFELSDVLTFHTRFGAKDAQIIRNEIRFQGHLYGSTEARGTT